MTGCVIFGGAGFVGTHLARHLLSSGRFETVHIADIALSPWLGQPGVTYSRTDVRLPIPDKLVNFAPEWIFNLAAIHREPGHKPWEYYQTNISAASNVCGYATRVGCRNIHFMSSISVYGPTVGPAAEDAPLMPDSPYGGSKLAAEAVHRQWRESEPSRRLIVSRPGVLYGPGDTGNIRRMIRAIKRGYFAFPGSPGIHKSYGYIYGLLDSMEFTMQRTEEEVIYNYVEAPTETLGEMVARVRRILGCRTVVLPIPRGLLAAAAHVAQVLSGPKNPIHPVRVRKAATPTHILPQVLLDMGYRFRYDFARSLEHWRQIAPEDFTDAREPGRGGRKLVLRLAGADQHSSREDVETMKQLQTQQPRHEHHLVDTATR